MKKDFFTLIDILFKKLYSLSEEKKGFDYDKDEQKDEGDFSPGR